MNKLIIKQELIAYGLSNVFGSFFSCFPSASSLSRSSILESSGSKSLVILLITWDYRKVFSWKIFTKKVSYFFSCSVILLVILFLSNLFEPLPTAVLASIILVALKNLLLQVKDFFTLWKINKIESVISYNFTLKSFYRTGVWFVFKSKDCVDIDIFECGILGCWYWSHYWNRRVNNLCGN